MDSPPVQMGWLKTFTQRHPELKVTAPRALEEERAIEPKEIEKSQLDHIADYEKKKYRPELNGNWDETMNSLTKKGKLLCVTRRNKKPMKKVLKLQSEHVTLGVYIFADGTHTKPELIVNTKGLPAVEEAILKKFIWRGAAKGWISNEIMLESIRDGFIPEIESRRKRLGLPPTEPAILHMDGHRSHNTEELRALLAAHYITLRLFVPHASHIQQPLDLVIFFKYKKLLQSFIDEILRDGCKIETDTQRRDVYILAASEVFPIAFSPYSIRSSFRRAGIWPPDPTPVLNNPCVTNVEKAFSLPKVKNPQVDISSKALVDVSEIPQRRAATLKARAEQAAKTRAQNEATAAVRFSLADLLSTTLTESEDSAFLPPPDVDEDESTFTGSFDEDEDLFTSIGMEVLTPTSPTSPPSSPPPSSLLAPPASSPSQQPSSQSIFLPSASTSCSLSFADTLLFQQLLKDKHAAFRCTAPVTGKRIPHPPSNPDFVAQ